MASAVVAAAQRKEAALEGARAGLGLEAGRYLALSQFDLLWKARP